MGGCGLHQRLLVRTSVLSYDHVLDSSNLWIFSMIIHHRIIGVIALVISLVLITLDHYYSKKIAQKDFEIKLNNQLLDSEQSTSEQHHDMESSPCGM